MAFPGIFNINYYMGDTYEFNVYPKDSSGNVFDMTTFPSAQFVISESRGGEVVAEAFSSISIDKSHVKCAIRPVDALLLDSTKSYVYDVQISKTASPYDFVYTLLTGNLNITEQVATPEPPAPPPSLAGAPQNLQLSEDPALTLNADWDAPAGDSQPTAYKIYGKVDSLSVPYTLITEVPATLTAFSASTIFGQNLVAGIEYGVKITSVNSAGENTTSFAEATITLVGEEVDPVENLLAPTNLILVENPAGILNASWTAPAEGDAPAGYNIYAKIDSLEVPYVLVGTVPASLTAFSSEYLEEPLLTDVEYGIKVVSIDESENEGGFVEGTITLEG